MESRNFAYQTSRPLSRPENTPLLGYNLRDVTRDFDRKFPPTFFKKLPGARGFSAKNEYRRFSPKLTIFHPSKPPIVNILL